ncbi:MAG TPA: hypothetical protein GX530_03405 [Corynebacteriales bacterium]|nr:hypothetical protein [Mycobacteriales bacterium]
MSKNSGKDTSQPDNQDFHWVDAHTGASDIRPNLGSAAGRRPRKRFPWWKVRQKWENLKDGINNFGS